MKLALTGLKLFFFLLQHGVFLSLGPEGVRFRNPKIRYSVIRAVNPPHFQILRIDRVGIIDEVIMHEI